MTLFITDSFLSAQGIEKDQYLSSLLMPLEAHELHDFDVLWSENLPLQKSMKRIRERLLKPTHSSINIIAHGKGGLDTLECLLRYPELLTRVNRLIFVQSPFWGTPLADFLVGHAVISPMVQLISWFKGVPFKAIEELSELSRQVYMIVNREKIQKLLSEIPTMTIGTSLEMPFQSITVSEKLMKSVHRLVSKYSGPHDGWVPLFSTRLSTESHIQWENTSHWDLAAGEKSAEIKNLIYQFINDPHISVKPLELAESPAKFPWGPSEEHSDSRLDRSYQLEIS